MAHAARPLVAVTGQTVDVYRNLNNGRLSVRGTSGPTAGRVLGHAAAVELCAVTFRIQRGGQERAIRERRRNVHAVARGRLVAHDDALQAPDHAVPLRYNVYVARDFHILHSHKIVTRAERLWIIDGRMYSMHPA